MITEPSRSLVAAFGLIGGVTAVVISTDWLADDRALSGILLLVGGLVMFLGGLVTLLGLLRSKPRGK